jgi:hypothetical protein
MIGETPLSKPRVLAQHPPNPLDVSEIDAQADDAHRTSTPARRRNGNSQFAIRDTKEEVGRRGFVVSRIANCVSRRASASPHSTVTDFARFRG